MPRARQATSIKMETNVRCLKYVLLPYLEVRAQLLYRRHTLRLVPMTKTGQTRVVEMPNVMWPAFLQWSIRRNELMKSGQWHPKPGMENLVLTSETGRALRQQDDSKLWRGVLTEAQKDILESQRVTWTMAFNRHIAVTLLRDAGINENLVAAMMGHNIAIEDRHYYQSQLSAQAAATAQLNGEIQRYMQQHTAATALRDNDVPTDEWFNEEA